MSGFYVFLGLTILLSIATLVPLLRHEGWWVRGFDFPRLQFFCLGLALILAELLLLDMQQWTHLGLVLAAALCTSVHAWWIVPYTSWYPCEVQDASDIDPQNSIRIISANVLTPNRQAADLLGLVREYNPDVLVTLESDAWWQAQLAELEADYPYLVQCPLDNLYGMHLYSRYPLSDSQVEYLVEVDVPSIHTQISLPSGVRLRAHFLHPAPPSPTENETSGERDAELVAVARSVLESQMPVIVAGDLNDVAWSETTRLFRKISGMLDPRVGRGMFNTFHADYWFARWPLDHLFHSDHFRLVDMQRLAGFGSDHFAIFTHLVYVPHLRCEQEGLEADIDDHLWAAEKMQSQGVQKQDVPTPGEL